MNCEVVDRDKYKSVISEPPTVFHSHEFNHLNQRKCSNLIYFLFSDSKYRGGIIFGDKNADLYSPFSAPYGGFSFLKEVSPKTILGIINSLVAKCKMLKYNRIEITLPPLIYSVDRISKLTHALFNSGFQLVTIDINSHIELAKKDKIKDFFNRNARRNFNSSDSSKLSFKKAISLNDKKDVYSTIKSNREQNGYPLKMDFSEIISTTELIKADFFICKSEDEDVAAAIIFNVNNEINQVIYWGHDLNYEGPNPMYFLVSKILEYYKNQKLKILDIGPSSLEGVVNDGLFYFKKSIGCKSSIKVKMRKEINNG